jgi:hypothetical protein
MNNVEEAELRAEIRRLEAELEKVLRESKKDAARLDKLELYHREMDDFDKKMNPGKTMWVLFADEGVQGCSRRIVDASIK